MMSKDEQHKILGQKLTTYQDKKSRLSTLEMQAQEIASDLRIVAALMCSGMAPTSSDYDERKQIWESVFEERLSPDDAKWPNQDEIFGLRREINRLRSEIEELRNYLKKQGMD